MADKITATLTAKETGGAAVTGAAAIETLTRRLKKESKDRRKCAREILDKYALLVQGSARKNLNKDPTRIDEGRLRSSIQTFLSQIFTLELAALVFTDVEYAAFVHWGTGIHGENPAGGHRQTPWIYYDEKRDQYFITRGMEPNMFLLDAFNQHSDGLRRDLRKCLAQGS